MELFGAPVLDNTIRSGHVNEIRLIGQGRSLP
jgi:hypothetical protein